MDRTCSFIQPFAFRGLKLKVHGIFCLNSAEGHELVFVASTLSNAEADELAGVVGLETGRVLLVHELIRRLDLELGDREQDGRVPGGVPSDGDPVERCVHPVVCPCLKNFDTNHQSSKLLGKENRAACVPGVRCQP